jgi:phosphate transport system ATP-binding protein
MSVAPIAPQACSIQIRGLHLWYGDVLALNDIDVDIPRGSVTALIGPSGGGKTTLLRSINRLNERYGNVRTTGRITVFGTNIYDPDVNLGELRRTVGMVFQRPNPLPLSIYANVAFGLRIHSVAHSLGRAGLDDLVRDALTEVALWDDVKGQLERDATTLPLEQQQKLCIARLLPLKPQIILMDEPCSALDAKGTAAIERLIATLTPAYTVVIVTHNMAQARRASEDCIFMLLGRVIEQGPTLEVFLRPKRSETELYVEGRYG